MSYFYYLYYFNDISFYKYMFSSTYNSYESSYDLLSPTWFSCNPWLWQHWL